VKKFNSFGNISTDSGSLAIKFSKITLFMHIYLQIKIKTQEKVQFFSTVFVICDLKMEV
jgi:hypothetical protein